jgi:hypothetical protein
VFHMEAEAGHLLARIDFRYRMRASDDIVAKKFTQFIQQRVPNFFPFPSVTEPDKGYWLNLTSKVYTIQKCLFVIYRSKK